MPPVARRSEYRREFHGSVLDDPYHWLRDPNYPTVQDAEILKYLADENELADAFLAPLKPLIGTLFDELKGRVKQDDQSVPVERDGFFYYWRFDPGQQYRRWYRRRAPDGAEELVLDEPALAEGKAFFRLGGFHPSPDGTKLAFSVDDTGAERFTIRVKDLTTGALLPDEITDTIDAAVWSAKGDVLLYARLNDEWRPYEIRAHVLGQDVAADTVLYHEPDTGFRVSAASSQSRELIFIQTGDHVTSEVRFIPADQPFAEPVLIAQRWAGTLYEADHGAGALFIRTNDLHRNFRVVRATLEHPSPSMWQEIIPGSDTHYIRGITPFARVLAVSERIDGLDQIRLRYMDGHQRYLAFPDVAYQAELGANPSPDPSAIRVEYSSLVRPATTFEEDIATGDRKTLKIQEIPSGYDPSLYVAERLMAPARDGAMIPISLVHRVDWHRGDGNPLHLYGYGAYGIGMEPSFSASRLSLLDRGFAYAIAHIRGGDELGRGWYEGGKGEQRWNCFHDFIDAATFLIAENYATPGGISISGGSAGGQLMGVVLNEAPELWRAAVAHVPFVDALNTMLDETLPLTPAEWPEWGNPIEDKAAFDYIRSYSPYDNVRAQAYPPLLITAGLNDPRVTYWEPAKWAALLRATKTDDQPLLMKTNMGAGHGGKSGRFDRLEEIAEEFAFLLKAFGRCGS
jgi:oligopeptidase B